MTPRTAGRGEMPRSDRWPVPPVENLPSVRPIIGYVYEIITSSPELDTEHPYVGKTEGTVHQRVHGPNGHTSIKSVAKDPWKARILPGRAGYRILERVRDTGEGDLANDAALRRAEAFWIDRLRTKYNSVRPVRPPILDARRHPMNTRMPRQLTAAQESRLAARRRTNLLLLAFATLAALGTFMVARVVVWMALPWPAAPWIASPAIGLMLAWVVFVSADHSLAVLTGRRAPRRRRRRYRR